MSKTTMPRPYRDHIRPVMRARTGQIHPITKQYLDNILTTPHRTDGSATWLARLVVLSALAGLALLWWLV